MKYQYDMIVIGGGAGGLTASGIAAHLGAKTMMIEKDRLGGDCTWTGCIPSKTLLKSAKVVHQMRNAAKYGLEGFEPSVDFRKVMLHVRATRERVYYDADRPDIFENMGIDVEQARARFLDDHTLELTTDGNARTVTSRYFIIATGSRPAIPSIAGLESSRYFSSDNIFEINDRPQRLAVFGGGPVGSELSQAFARLGTEVTVIEQGDRILVQDDPSLTSLLRDILLRENIRFLLQSSITAVTNEGGDVSVALNVNGEEHRLLVDAILVAVGRKANVELLGLEAAGINYDEKGIAVDGRCCTNRAHIYAIGDVTGRYHFTHMSEHMAKVAATSALTKVPLTIDSRHVPRVTFTDPELAAVGKTEEQLNDEGTSYEVYHFPFSKIDRAITESETEGLIRVFARGWNGAILGATILGANAGDMICQYAVAMRNGITLRRISDTIHPYPTYGLGVRRAADQWYVQRLPPALVNLLQKTFGYRGRVIRHERGTVV